MVIVLVYLGRIETAALQQGVDSAPFLLLAEKALPKCPQFGERSVRIFQNSGDIGVDARFAPRALYDHRNAKAHWICRASLAFQNS